MMKDWCTWDDDYNLIVQSIRKRLTQLAAPRNSSAYTTVLMQGSGTFSVEAVLTSAVGNNEKILILANGAYGLRMGRIAEQAGIAYEMCNFDETVVPDPGVIEQILKNTPAITHVAAVHCETTTGMVNPVEEIGKLATKYGKVFIIDAMSSFGGIPMDIEKLHCDFLISSANKCIQGVPGFGFIIASRAEIARLKGKARSYSLDLFDQWKTMDEGRGKWRFTSPTHVVRAFSRALEELDEEGGVEKRFIRYQTNHGLLVEGMQNLDFSCLLEPEKQSPIITAFHNPDDPQYQFPTFYEQLKSRGFVIYPGKVTNVDTFRIGTIGHLFPENIKQLIKAVQSSMYWKKEH